VGCACSILPAGRFTKKHAREIEECANRYTPKGVLFNEIAMPDPLLSRYGGVVMAPTR
jgi:hypothetical protein